jgi:hypothetical protein
MSEQTMRSKIQRYNYFQLEQWHIVVRLNADFVEIIFFVIANN